MSNPDETPDSTTLRQRQARLAYALLILPLCIIGGIILLPVLWNFWLSLHPVSLGEIGGGIPLDLSRVSLRNFLDILRNPRFYTDAGVTLAYSFLGVGSSLVFGLAAALLLNESFPGRQFFRGLYLFPYIAPIIAVAYVSWTWMLDPATGVVSWGLQELGILDGPIGFLTRWPYALISIILFQTWRYGPFCMLFILARLQSIPEPLYEAARIDGATPLQRFRDITLPQLRGVLATLFLLRFMWTFNKFADVYLLTSGSGGTEVLPILVYELFIGEQNLGQGAALSVVLFVILGVFLFVYFRWFLREW